MIGVLLASHGMLAEGLKDSIELIMGEVKQLATVSLLAGQDIEEFKGNVLDKAKQLDTGEGVIIYVDVFGASPYNAALYTSLVGKDDNINVHVVTGMNLPMLLETLSRREFLTIQEMVEIAIETGHTGIIEAVEAMCEEDDLGGDYE